MKVILIIYFLGCFYSPSLFGQSEKESVKVKFQEYFKSVELKDNKKTLDFVYPKLFKFFTKEEILRTMDNFNADTSVSVITKDGKVIQMAENMEIKGITYTVLKYSFTLVMNFKPKRDKNNVEDKNYSDYVHEVMKEHYGINNVVYHREKNQVIVNGIDEVYAIKDPAFDDWKFLENKQNIASALEKLLPKKVLYALN